MEENNKVELNELAIDSLKTSAKWSTFLAIIGFIGIAFLLLAALFAGTALSAMSNNPELHELQEMQGMHNMHGMNPFESILRFLPVLYVILAIIYFFPVYYLFKYASGMKKALNFRKSEMVAEALTYLKSHHKFLGIMTIVVISLYFLFFIGAIIFAATMASRMM